ncbi:sigma-54 interaction domain-containing protein [Cytobacillus purgationiresistens]|uniref:Transcriptional regulator with PAS, ATPase and Fis domain n=1 Tax=Cytobacillus purgationiresistens TaxID=863449 RepID=A0ABU0AH46_9BACI|nr:sigma 54-interacting transcriptional regulator [Cytobacillus purgationiresistens]MDQ0270586.1 transcriptional regulator with PAS, ATPase and Fis domain [Cytobacillus purgationiresistens]
MRAKESLLIVTYTENTLKSLMDQLTDIGLLEFFDISGLTIDDLEYAATRQCSLILVSSQIVYKMARPYLDNQTPHIITRRTINYARIGELLKISKGTNVYLVSDLKQSAEESISLLKEIGIELDFQPYFPQEPIDRTIQIAITPGEPQFIPDTIQKTYNIGSRLIDISTLVEIFNYFNISPFSSEIHLSARYVQSLVELSKELRNEIFKSRILQNTLDSVVQNIEDGVLVYNNHNELKAYNKTADEFLQIAQIRGNQQLENIPPAFYYAIRKLEVGQASFVEIEGTTFHMRKKRIMVDSEVHHTLILFRKAEDYQKIEYDYRSKAKQKNLMTRYRFDDIKTVSASVIDMLKIASRLAKSDSTVLILGETGTGKEVLGQAIHRDSFRRELPFVGVNFGAISESLMESELFGYEPGSFTGARKNGHVGMFEQAHLGSIFLDEIGDASPVIQNRLLRVIQERQIMRVGGDTLIPLDVRIIAATNKNFKRLIEEGLFREDLFYRLNVLPLRLLPLRERKEDIILLINLFSKEFQERLGRTPFVFTREAIQACENYDWPGNVRELRNVVEYVAHICEDKVHKEELPFGNARAHQPLVVVHQQEGLVEIHDDLLQKGFLEDMLCILTYLNREAVLSAGRDAMMDELREQGLLLTTHQLRYRQKVLNDHELIGIERGRAGSKITEKGRRFIELFSRSRC